MKQKRKKSIVRRSILRISLLGLIILIGVISVAGFVFYETMMDELNTLAYSYSEMASIKLSNEYTQQLIETDDLRDLLINLYYDDGQDRTEEEKNLTNFWVEIDLFLYEALRSNENIRNFQVIVPEENKVLMIWDMHADGTAKSRNGETRIYRDGERERLDEICENPTEVWIFTDNKDQQEMFIHKEDGQLLASALFPIYGTDEDEIIAFSEVDVSISGIQKSIIRLMLGVTGIILIIMIICILVYFRRLQTEIISPVISLGKAAADAVDKLREGNQVFVLDIHTGDEIEDLSHSFERMEESLASYIVENTSITAERERLSTELELAATIQSDMLPARFPAFPDRKEFDIYAIMDPAKEVGGDFYDFFFTDEDTLALVIADVSGKGVPASLFMMRSMLMIRNITKGNPNPAEVLTDVNLELCENNDSAMFVTVWLGLLNLKTGHLKASNAGHEYPIIKKPDGEFELFTDPHSFVLGGSRKLKLKEYELTLEPGSQLFIYTDGAPEAKNPENEMIGTENLVDIVNQASDESPEMKLKDIRQSISDFVKDAEQFDDLTMMCLYYFGENGGIQ